MTTPVSNREILIELRDYSNYDEKSDAEKIREAEERLIPQLERMQQPELAKFQQSLVGPTAAGFERLKKRNPQLAAITSATTEAKATFAEGSQAERDAIRADAVNRDVEFKSLSRKQKKRVERSVQADAAKLVNQLLHANAHEDFAPTAAKLKQLLRTLPKGNAKRVKLEAQYDSLMQKAPAPAANSDTPGAEAAPAPVPASASPDLPANAQQLIDAAVKSKNDVTMEAGGLENPLAQEGLSAIEGKPNNLSPEQDKALHDYFHSTSDEEREQALAALPEHLRKRVADNRNRILAFADDMPAGPQKDLVQGMIAASKSGHTPSEQEANQWAAAALQDNWTKGPVAAGLTRAKIKDLPLSLQSAALEWVEGQEAYDMKIKGLHSELRGLIRSGMPIEILVMLFMSVFAQLTEEKMRQKMREITFAQQVEKLQADNKAGFKPSDFGIRVKPSDALVQELQALTQQMTQMNQALAGTLRMLQDNIMTIIRNIR